MVRAFSPCATGETRKTWLIKALLIPHELSKECLFLIKKNLYGDKVVFEVKKVPFCKILSFEKKMAALGKI